MLKNIFKINSIKCFSEIKGENQRNNQKGIIVNFRERLQQFNGHTGCGIQIEKRVVSHEFQFS